MEPVEAVIVMSHLVANVADDALRRVLKVLERRQVTCLLPATEVEKHREMLSTTRAPWEALAPAGLQEAVPRAQLCLVLGGDGTTLRAFRRMGNRLPVAGVNLGRVGFLSTMDKQMIERDLERALSGDVTVHRLPGLRVSGGGGDGLVGRRRLALNDVFIGRRHESTICHLAYHLNRDAMYDVRCDGLVVATPAGSSAYNLSVGGPLLGLGAEAYAITFVAAHTLTARSVVAAGADRLTVTNLSSMEPAHLVLDGEPVGQLAPEDRVEVQLIPDAARLALLPEDSLYRNFRDRFL
ncbi:MAG: NAD(+)/NADH kinase [Gaiellales bacterium]|nr:NAD(+)/NADH kinase [Gaiellales bacterium]